MITCGVYLQTGRFGRSGRTSLRGSIEKVILVKGGHIQHMSRPTLTGFHFSHQNIELKAIKNI